MSTPKRYTITTALPYTNGPIHIGHMAGVYVPADIYARYLRGIGKDVALIGGSDEHGVAIPMRAKKEGVSPQVIIDKYHNIIKDSFEDFGISFDNYSRTSSKIHHETASEFFEKMHHAGQFIEEVTEQLYDPEANQFLADRFVTGTCPKCGHEEAYGDQCEKCGSSLNATDLIDPKSTISGAKPITKSTKHWFLPLDKYEDFLKEWILEGHKKDWKTNVYGQCKSWIDDGLKPRAVTRDLDWGIPVPVDGADGKVLYVWFDAPIGYISSTKEWAAREGKNWEDYWKKDDTKLVHFIGKDNIVFHCIIFPSMWAVWLHEYLEDFPGQQDVLRYALTANAPETKDNDFTWKDFQTRNNSELVAIFGNFINRAVVLTHKYYNGVIPTPSTLEAIDIETLEKLKAYPAVIASSIERYRFREASQELMNVARLGNKYLADLEPWKMIKVDEERTKTVMYVALQIASALATLSEPFFPFTSKKLKHILAIEDSFVPWNGIVDTETLLASGHQINKGELLFSKIEDATIEAQLQKLEDTKKANEAAAKEVEPQKDTCTFDDFTKLDIRTGTILEAKKMPKAKKLLVLKVDTGIDVRTIVSGIAEHFAPEAIIGKQVSVLVNLAPRALRGVESEGMILMTETPNGKLVFVNPDEDGVCPGAQIS